MTTLPLSATLRAMADSLAARIDRAHAHEKLGVGEGMIRLLPRDVTALRDALRMAADAIDATAASPPPEA